MSGAVEKFSFGLCEDMITFELSSGRRQTQMRVCFCDVCLEVHLSKKIPTRASFQLFKNSTEHICVCLCKCMTSSLYICLCVCGYLILGRAGNIKKKAMVVT